MANNETLGASFSINITELKAGLAQANRMIRESESEFKAAAAGMDDWTQSQEGLEARIKYLNTSIDQHNSVIAKTTEEKEKVVKAMQDEGKSQDEINKVIDEANKILNKEYNALEKNKKELQNQKSELDNLGNSSKESAKELDDLTDSVKDTGDGFTVAKGAISGFISNGLTALVGKCSEAVSSIMGLADETREFRQDMSSLETAFSNVGFSAEEATGTWKDLYGILGEDDRAVEAANNISRMAKNQQDLNDWVRISTGILGTYQDALPVESLAESAAETAKTATVAGSLADALNWSSEAALMFSDYMNEEVTTAEDAFNEALKECNTEADRQKLITETLTKLYGKSADAYRKNASEVISANKAQADYNLTMAELGEEMEPVNMAMSEMKLELARELAPVLKSQIIPAFQTFFKELGKSGAIEALGDIIEFVAKNFETLAVGIGTAVVAWKTMSVISTVTTAMKGATTAMGALNAVMAANPIGAVVTAIAALVAVLGTVANSIKNAKDSYDYMTEAVDENIEANEKWQETMDNARFELGDYSDFANKAGETTSSLAQKMDESQEKITEIWSKAFEENRDLRQEEINEIKKYNKEYIEAQEELVALQEQKLKAQIDALQWQLDNMELTQEQEQGILNTISEIRAEHNDVLADTIASELVLLEQRKSNKQITDEEYKKQYEETLAKQQEYATKEKEIVQGTVDSALQAARERIEINNDTFSKNQHYYNSEQEIAQAYQAKVDQINNDESLSWWDKQFSIRNAQMKFLEDMATFKSGADVMWTDYSFLTDQNISQNTQAFFDWAADTKIAGQELTEENKTTASDILNAYASLPEDLQESGEESLRGMAEGMAKAYPELQNASEMDMDELIGTMRSVLGLEGGGTSTVTQDYGDKLMQGLEQGAESREDRTSNVFANIASKIMDVWNNIWGIHSPSDVTANTAEMLMRGLEEGAKDRLSDTKRIFHNIGNELAEELSGEASATINPNMSGKSGLVKGGSVIVNQYNTFSQAHSRYEIFKSKQQTTAAVRLAMAGGV